MDELHDGLWRWTARHPEFHPKGFPEVACFALRDDLGAILVDPLLPEDDEEVLTALDGIVSGRVRILITVPYHVRSSEALWQRYRERFETTIHGHPLCTRRLQDDAGFRPFGDAPAIDGDIVPNPIGSPRRSELPLWLPSHRALAFGDAVIDVDGELRVWDEPLDSERRRRWYEDRYLPTLEGLLDHDVERVLVTHGEPVLRGGRRALEAAFAQPPWQRDKGGG
jgi:glyoxylase-like metal-dependent hydrolase (beta-lactamase superfamily II)